MRESGTELDDNEVAAIHYRIWLRPIGELDIMPGVFRNRSNVGLDERTAAPLEKRKQFRLASESALCPCYVLV